MDPAEYSKYVALDAEITPTAGPGKKHQPQPTQVAITDINGKVLFNEYLFLSNPPLVQMSKKRADKLKAHAKRTYAAARNEVLGILRGKIVVGHDLKHDFEALRIHPVRDGLAGVLDSANLPFFKQRDVSLYPARGLKNLTDEFLHRNIQTGSKMHDATEDAKASANLIRTTFPYLNAPMPITRETLAASKIVQEYARRMGIDKQTVNFPNLLRFEPVKSAENYVKEMEELEIKKSAEMYLSELEGLNMRRTANNYLREMEGLNMRRKANNYLREMEGLNMRRTANNYLREMEGLTIPKTATYYEHELEGLNLTKPGVNHFANLVNGSNKVSRRKTRKLGRRAN